MPLNKKGGTSWNIITRLVAGAPHRYLVMRRVEILAPTFLEYWAVRRTLPHARASWAGVRLARWNGARQDSIVGGCGLAAALPPGLRPGPVLIPDWVDLADGGIV